MIRRATLADLESITVIYNEVILEGGLLAICSRCRLRADVHGSSIIRTRYSIFVKSVGNSPWLATLRSSYRNGRNAFNETCEISYYLASQQRGLALARSSSAMRLNMPGIWDFVDCRNDFGMQSTKHRLAAELAFQFQADCPRRRRSMESISIMSSFLAVRRPIHTVP